MQDSKHETGETHGTTTPSDLRSGARSIALETPAFQESFLSQTPNNQIEALNYLFEFWAMPHQLPPMGDWRTWVILGGRGAGKTRAGAEWVRSMVEGPLPKSAGLCSRFALVGATYDQAREVMVLGESGIIALTPSDRCPVWNGSRRMLTWPNGATAQVFSAQDAEALRGPQFDGVWADELAKWTKASEAWDMLQFALRLGEVPQACVSTTPRRSKVLEAILASDSTVQTHATTSMNAANLAPSFLDEVYARYGGTRQGREELDGVMLTDTPGALWTSGGLQGCGVDEVPPLSRIVVAVDPAVSSKSTSDECGIVVAGAYTDGPKGDWRAYVLEDATIAGASPLTWAQAALDAMKRHGASQMVVEINQGGNMVESTVRTLDPIVSFKGVHASVGKGARAEPVAALYEQGRVFHAKGLSDLEDQMCQMTAQGFQGSGSPDRVDALVWALTALMIEPKGGVADARIRSL